jgi:uncharacterized lipoprotein YmbA
MTIKACLPKIGLGVCAVIFLLAGCRGPVTPIEFYTLTPLVGITEADETAGLGNAVAVGVGPLQIPKLIDRPQIISRDDGNRISVDEFHRWGGSLYEDFLIVLTLNLAALLRTNQVAAYPWEEYFGPDYRIYMEVHQFEGRLGEYAQLNITWTITGRQPADVKRVQHSVIKEPVQSGGFDAFVAAKSRILAALSREMARAILEIHGGKE